MAAAWPEIVAVKTQNRRELSLQGADIRKRIEDNGLDKSIYSLVALNHLEISKTTLSGFSEDLGRLSNLTSLILHNNQISSLPNSISNLSKLKTLDLSNNKLETVSDNLIELTGLHTLNLSVNQISEFPSIEGMVGLHILHISHNKLKALPDGIANPKLVHLSHINAASNEITEIPAGLSGLQHLNILDMSENQITEVPPELSECPRMKDLNLKGNKLKDRRLGKLIQQCASKSVIDYLANLLAKEQEKGGKAKGKKKGKKKLGKENEVEDLAKNMINVLRLQDEIYSVRVTANVINVRPYIVCCLIKNLDFHKTVNMFKRFITLQTNLHDTVCQKRQVATIATHDASKVKWPLTYDARLPSSIKITPLFKSKESSASDLMRSLRKEADDLRREKKRNAVSGIHKYLELLKYQELYPCLVDAEDQVISFPPITNSDKTKISSDTTSILVEVTSSTSLDTCKNILDQLIIQTLEMGVGTPSSEDETPTDTAACAGIDLGSSNQKLIVEQVKILDSEGSMKVIYPSRTDLCRSDVEVERNYD